MTIFEGRCVVTPLLRYRLLPLKELPPKEPPLLLLKEDRLLLPSELELPKDDPKDDLLEKPMLPPIRPPLRAA